MMTETHRLIEQLSRADAYPHTASDLEVHQTHISVVFLAGDYAYKIKKEVDFGFVDYSSLQKRKNFCAREVELNRRLAPKSIYLDTVPITREPNGNFKIDGAGAIVEWAVKMKRLPEHATFSAKCRRSELTETEVRKLGKHVATFHRNARSGPEISKHACFEAVEQNTMDNFEACESHVGLTVHKTVFERLHDLAQDTLERNRSLIAKRAQNNVPRDCHGDLRLKHVYDLTECKQPDLAEGLAVVDCIEFNDRFRYSDPICDVAFLYMDLWFERAYQLADEFFDTYIESTDDSDGCKLIPLYGAYRCLVRAKVEGLKADEKELSKKQRDNALTTARAHWLLALQFLAPPRDRPCLILIGGLPGTGKTTIASTLSERSNFVHIDSDRVRKQLADADADANSRDDYGKGIYTPEWTRRTYREAAARASSRIREGKRVIVDASFSTAERRAFAFAVAESLRIPCYFIECSAPRETIEKRLNDRTSGPSDADLDIYDEMASAWESPGDQSAVVTMEIATTAPVTESVKAIESELLDNELL